jgi:hypothetical protein
MRRLQWACYLYGFSFDAKLFPEASDDSREVVFAWLKVFCY